MLQAESSSALLCLWTARSLPAAPHPVSRRRSCLPLRTDQCFCPMGTFTPLLVRTLRRTFQGPSGRRCASRGLPDRCPDHLSPFTSHRLSTFSAFPPLTPRSRVLTPFSMRTLPGLLLFILVGT